MKRSENQVGARKQGRVMQKVSAGIEIHAEIRCASAE
jgi:hypothetical protein